MPPVNASSSNGQSVQYAKSIRIVKEQSFVLHIDHVLAVLLLLCAMQDIESLHVVKATSDYTVLTCNLHASVKRVSNQGRAATYTALERGLTFLRCGVLQTLRVMKLGRLLKAVKLFRCTFQEHAVLLLCRLMIAPPSFADDDRFHPHLLSSLL